MSLPGLDAHIEGDGLCTYCGIYGCPGCGDDREDEDARDQRDDLDSLDDALPAEGDQEYIFTFGLGQPLGGCYTVVTAPSYEEARQKMVAQYGDRWAFQYASREEAGVNRWRLSEVPFGTPNPKVAS